MIMCATHKSKAGENSFNSMIYFLLMPILQRSKKGWSSPVLNSTVCNFACILSFLRKCLAQVYSVLMLTSTYFQCHSPERELLCSINQLTLLATLDGHALDMNPNRHQTSNGTQWIVNEKKAKTIYGLTCIVIT